MEQKALALGAKSFTAIDAVQEYYDKIIRFLVFGNVLKGGVYPLSVSAERTIQALAIIRQAKLMNAQYIAHGSTGAGNDQVRFDLIFNILGNGLEVITPIRDLKLSRQAEIDFLQQHGVEYSWEKAQYSINKGLWGTSVGGKETLTSHEPLPESAYPSQCVKTEQDKIKIELFFEKGELQKIDNQQFTHPSEAIKALDVLAKPYGIGREIHVGDTIIGIKGRVGFEAAAALITIKAHQLLEKHTLTKWQQYWKDQQANWYGMFLHEAQYLDPVMRNIETFLIDTQKNVTGSVFIELAPYRFDLQGVASDYDLMNAKFGSYGEMNLAWSGDDVKGFTKILGNQTAIALEFGLKPNFHYAD